MSEPAVHYLLQPQVSSCGMGARPQAPKPKLGTTDKARVTCVACRKIEGIR